MVAGAVEAVAAAVEGAVEAGRERVSRPSLNPAKQQSRKPHRNSAAAAGSSVVDGDRVCRRATTPSSFRSMARTKQKPFESARILEFRFPTLIVLG